MSFLEKVGAWGKRLVPQKPIDPSAFGDPIATRTQWTPLKHGGASFGTHRLVRLPAQRLALKKSGASILFGSAFIGAGLFIAVAYAAARQHGAYALLSIPFVAVGLFAVWPAKLIFDGNTRQFLSRKPPVSFSTIHAIQLVQEIVPARRGNFFWSYELNLVLKDGERLNVVDHADRAGIRSSAQQLAALIGCKLWDTTTDG